MKAGRNDPCPCGSGRKYKRCCMAADESAMGDAGVRAKLREVATREPVWQAEAIPLLSRIEEPGSPRPVVMLVTAGGFSLGTRAVGRLGGSAAAIADELEEAIAEAARTVGSWPRAIQVRHVEVAEALRPRLSSRDVSVAAVDPLPALEEVGRALIEGLTGVAIWPPACRVEVWSGWGLPRRVVAEVFGAAAEYWRAAPWRIAANLQAPRSVMPTGRVWKACVLGNAGEEFGLALYSDEEDLYAQAALADDDDPFEGVRGRIITLDYSSSSEVPRAARGEARSAGWRTAGSDAFPMLTTVNTPGGGVTEDDMADLVLLLGAVPAFMEEHRLALLREQRTEVGCEPIDWLHEATGVRLQYSGEAMDTAPMGPEAPEPSDEIREEFREVIATAMNELGDVSEDELADVVNRRMNERMRAYNDRPQAELGGLSPSQIGRLLDHHEWLGPTSPVQLRRDIPLFELENAHMFHNARALLRYAVERGGLAATDAGNLKLAVVADLLDRIRMDPEHARRIRAVSKRITEMDVRPLHEARILVQIDGLILRKGARFLPAHPELLEDENAGELFARLFDACFRRFNLSYGHLTEWPELQYQMGYTIHQLGEVAQNWSTPRELLDAAVLPAARDRGPEVALLDFAAAAFDFHILERLAGFGLLETRPGLRMRPRSDEVDYQITPLFTRFLRTNL